MLTETLLVVIFGLSLIGLFVVIGIGIILIVFGRRALHTLREMHKSVSEQQLIWRSADGSYEAASLEDLLEQLIEDDDGPLSDAEKKVLINVFAKINGADDLDDDEDWESYLS